MIRLAMGCTDIWNIAQEKSMQLIHQLDTESGEERQES